MNVCTKYHGNPSKSCQDISFKTINVNLMPVAVEKSVARQIQGLALGPWSWMFSISCQSFKYLLRFLSLDQSNRLTNSLRLPGIAKKNKNIHFIIFNLVFLLVIWHPQSVCWHLDESSQLLTINLDLYTIQAPRTAEWSSTLRARQCVS